MSIEILMRVAQVLIAVAMIAIILVQRGTGANAGAGFGAGASGTVFGARGSGNFLSRSTAVLAATFFVLTMAMGVIASRSGEVDVAEPDLGVMTGVGEARDAEVPAFPVMTDEASEIPVLETPAQTGGSESLPESMEQRPEAGGTEEDGAREARSGEGSE